MKNQQPVFLPVEFFLSQVHSSRSPLQSFPVLPGHMDTMHVQQVRVHIPFLLCPTAQCSHTIFPTGSVSMQFAHSPDSRCLLQVSLLQWLRDSHQKFPAGMQRVHMSACPDEYSPSYLPS